jgi:Dolichyl-phosphate-mannose-protein mannosyltransferase
MPVDLAVPEARARVSVFIRHGESLVLVIFGLSSGLIDWQIASTWALPAWIPVLGAVLVAVTVGAGIVRPQLREFAAGVAVAVLYAMPVIGGIARWHLMPSTTALIGDGAYQMQLARNVLMRGVDPYGFNYVGTGLERAPWNQPFPNPSLHHLDYWPGTIVLPLPVQAAFQGVLGWWDERIWLMLAAIAVWILLRRLVPGPAGRMAAIAFFLIPGHSLLAILGDNDLPMVALLLAATLATANRKFLVAGLLMGLAIATKQTSLIAVPILVAYAVGQNVGWREFLRAAGVAVAAVCLLLAPFVLWNAGAFVADTLLFNFAGGAEAYPIQGLGLSSILLEAGIIHGARDAFPFLLIQLPLVIAVWLLAWRRLIRYPLASELIVWAGLAFFVFLFTNRFAQQTYILLGVELMLAGLLARLHNSGNDRLVVVRPHRFGGRLPPGPRDLGSHGPSPTSGEDARRHSVAD